MFDIVNCAYCKRAGTNELDPDGKTWHMDHVVALANGGDDSVDNLVKSCQFCNLSKGTKSVSNPSKRYTIPQAARLAGKHPDSIRRAYRKGVLKIGGTDPSNNAIYFFEEDLLRAGFDLTGPKRSTPNVTATVEANSEVQYLRQQNARLLTIIEKLTAELIA